MSEGQQPEEILFRIRVDADTARKEIIEFTKQISEVKNAQSLLDAEYKKGNKTLAEHTSATVDNKIKLKELTGEVKIREKALEQQAKAEKTAADSCERLKVALDGLRNAYGKLSDAEKEAASGQALKKQIDAQSAAYTQSIIKQNAAEQSTVGMRAAVRDLRQEYILLTKAERETARGKELQKHILEINEELTKTEKGVGVFGRSVGDYFGQLKGLFSGGGGIGSAISGISSLIPGLGGVIGPVIGGLTSGLEETTKGLVRLRGEVQQVMGIAGAELDAVTAKIQTLETVFESDFNETLLAGNALAKQFGIDTVAALDLIRDGFLAGANANGEFLDSIKEYSTQFDAAGGSAEQFIAILSQNAKEGIFSDKGIDAIKEGMLSLREQTKATVDALKPLGEETNKAIRTAVDEGRTFDAIKLISKGLNETGLTAAETGTIIADVFKGAGEDAGLKYLQGLYKINTELDKQIDLSNELVRRQKESAEATEQYNLAMNAVAKTFGSATTSSGVFFTNLKTEGAKFLTGMILIFRALAEMGAGVGKIFEGLFNPTKFFKVGEGVKQLVNSVGKVRRDAELDQKLLDKELAEKGNKEKQEQDRKFKAGQNESDKKATADAAKEAEKRREEAKKDALRLLNDQKAEIEMRLLEVEKGSEKELVLKEKLIRKQLQIEKTGNDLSANQRKLAAAKAEEEVLKIKQEFAFKQAEEIFIAEEAALKTSLANRLISQEEFDIKMLEQERKRLEAQFLLQQQKGKVSEELKTKLAENSSSTREKEFQKTLRLANKAFDEGEIALKESYARQEISKKEFDDSMLKLEEGRLAAEILMREKNGEDVTALRNQQADQDIANMERRKQADQDLLDAQYELELQRIAIAQDALSAFADLVGEQSALGKVALAAQKGLAIAEIVINLQKEISKLSAAGGPLAIPFIAAATLRAGVGIATVAKQNVQTMEAGGIIPDEYSPTPQKKLAGGGVLHGPRHSQGGIKGTGRFGNVEVEGGEIVLTRGVKKDPLLFRIANLLNIRAGGRPLMEGNFHAAGGIIKPSGMHVNLPQETRVALAGGTSGFDYKKLGEVIEKIPAPVAVWQDFEKVDKSQKQIKLRSDI